MSADKFIAPLVAGALGFATGTVADMDPTVSMGIGGVAAVAGYLVTSQPWSKKPVKEPVVSEESSDFSSEEEVVKQQQKKKSKKKKGKQSQSKKKYKRSSYDEEPELTKSQPKTVDPKYAGMGKSAIRKARRREREALAAAEEARLAVEAKKAKKKKRKKKRKGSEPVEKKVELTEEEKRAAAEAKDLAEGWIKPKEHIKNEDARKKAQKKAALEGPKKAGAESTVYVQIPNAQRGKVFGRKACNIVKLRESLGVNITLPKPGGVQNYVTIQGTEAACSAAETSLRQLMDKGFSDLTNPGQVSAVVAVPEGKIGVIMGTKGRNFSDIIKMTNVSKLEKSKDAKFITIIGSGRTVEAAKEALEELAANGFSTITHPTWTKTTFPISQDMVPAVLGKRGSTIEKVTKSTKTWINMPKSGSSFSGVLTITGEEENVRMAVEMIKKVVAQASIPKPEVPIPVAFQPYVYNEADDWK